MLRTRITRRVALTAAALSLAAAVPVAAAQAQSGPAAVHKAPAAAKVAVIGSGDPRSAVSRVAVFYGAYIDAVWDGGSTPLARQLRAHYLTPALQKRLAAWERRQHADGVLRAQNTPTGWRVTYTGSGGGHAFTTVRLTWGSAKHPVYTNLKVQSDLRTKKISDIK